MFELYLENFVFPLFIVLSLFTRKVCIFLKSALTFRTFYCLFLSVKQNLKMAKFLRYSFTYMGNRTTNFHICMTYIFFTFSHIFNFWRSANLENFYGSHRKKELKSQKLQTKNFLNDN